MTVRYVRSQAAEDTLFLLRQTFADGVRDVAAAGFGRHGGGVGLTGTFDPRAVQRQGCYLRLVSLVEAYVDVMSSELFQAELAGASTAASILLQQAEAAAVKGWPDREDAFKKYFTTPLSARAGHVDLKKCTDVRNAIAHGVGQLTQRQRNALTRQRMADVGVPVRDNWVILTDDALRMCLSTCVAFVGGLDRALAAR